MTRMTIINVLIGITYLCFLQIHNPTLYPCPKSEIFPRPQERRCQNLQAAVGALREVERY